MKKLLFLLILISSCKKEVYYPSKHFFEENNPTEIIIDELSFKEITDSIRRGLYKKEKYFIKLNDSKNIYNISLFTDTGGFIKERNGLYLKKDSLILFEGKYPISNLSKYLKLHYENNDKEYFYAISYKCAYVKLILNKKDESKELKESLLNLVQVYNKTNIKNKDNIDFHIMIHYPLESVFPALIPPPPSSIEK